MSVCYGKLGIQFLNLHDESITKGNCTENQANGAYILTGSQNFLLTKQITQSLAGRVALFNLLPFSITELQAGNFIFNDWEKYALEGSYPRKWMNEIENHCYYDNYLKTYVERDVRLIKNIMNLDTFQSLIKFQQFAGNQKNILIYGGKENQVRENLQIIGFDQIAAM